MSRKLYLECASGISGDMTVAALLDLGADESVLLSALDSLKLSGYEIAVQRVKKSGIDACDFAVLLDQEHENHDHDMEYLHGSGIEGHEHGQGHGEHVHRTLADIEKIILRGDLTERAKELSLRIFGILAEAEGKAHHIPASKVHFHEVGAVDSIVDIVATAVCIDNLGITDVIVEELCEGRGCVRCQHGVIPVPVPAVVNIAEAYHLNLHITGEKGEFVTPTGAAIVAALRTGDTLPERFTIVKTGIGAGKRTYNRPGILRAMMILETGRASDHGADVIYKLETNIDDCTGENLGYVMELLMHAGARDVHYLPVFMKKNRPAYQLNVICPAEDIPKLEEIIFKNTTTIGIRRTRMERTVLSREIRRVSTSLGEAAVKVCRVSGESRIYPEYESVSKLCRESGRPYREVYMQIAAECEGILENCPGDAMPRQSVNDYESGMDLK